MIATESHKICNEIVDELIATCEELTAQRDRLRQALREACFYDGYPEDMAIEQAFDNILQSGDMTGA